MPRFCSAWLFARSVAERGAALVPRLLSHALHEGKPRFCSAWLFARSVAERGGAYVRCPLAIARSKAHYGIPRYW